MSNLELGKLAPDFTLPSVDGKDVSLKDFLGKNVVLYFYPKNNTPGWNKEASEFRDNYKQFQGLNTVIIGVSKDTLKSHVKFKDKFELQFLTLSDEDKKVHELYDVLKLKKMFGKEYMGVDRSTFIIDKKGVLVKEYRKVKITGHVEEVLDYVKNNLAW